MISSKSGFHISVPSMVGIYSKQYKWGNLYFQSIGPLGRCFHRVAMSVGPLLCYFFRGLSLALRSQDQFKASDWRRRRRRGGRNFFIFFFFWRKSPLAAAATMAAGRAKKKCLKASWQWSYYPHRSRDALSHVCGILN